MAEPRIVSLGCRLNIAESESMRGLVGARDVVVVNSCAVTGQAVRQSRRAVRRLRRERPDATLVVTGCAAEIDPHAFAAMPEVDRVIGNARKLDAAAWASDAPLIVEPFDAAVAVPVAGAFAGHARAFVEVQNGCDHACTFCIIPQGRGPSRSLPAGGVVEQVRALVAAGHREVVLTGVDMTSYGADLPGIPTLGHLVERILRLVPELPRLRLSSLDCAEIDDRLFALLAHEPRVMPHVHLSLQAGDDLILKRMKRRHARAQAVALARRLQAARAGIAIGADLVAGFPTEDESAFVNTLRLIEECRIVHAHIFPFSARAGTPAARMPQLPPAIVRERAERLRAAAARVRTGWLHSLVGTAHDVLVERPGDHGHAGNFATVALSAPAPVGGIVRQRIAAVDGDRLVGTPA